MRVEVELSNQFTSTPRRTSPPATSIYVKFTTLSVSCTRSTVRHTRRRRRIRPKAHRFAEGHLGAEAHGLHVRQRPARGQLAAAAHPIAVRAAQRHEPDTIMGRPKKPA